MSETCFIGTFDTNKVVFLFFSFLAGTKGALSHVELPCRKAEYSPPCRGCVKLPSPRKVSHDIK